MRSPLTKNDSLGAQRSARVSSTDLLALIVFRLRIWDLSTECTEIASDNDDDDDDDESVTCETGKAVTRDRIDTISAVSTLMARQLSTVIDVNFTVLAAESSLTNTPEVIDVIETRSSVEAR